MHHEEVIPEDNKEIIAEEVQVAYATLPQYAPHIIMKPVDDSDEAHFRALLQSVFRLELARVEVSRLLAQYVEMPAGSCVLPTESHFLNLMTAELAQNKEVPDAMIAEITGMFNLTKEPLPNLYALNS